MKSNSPPFLSDLLSLLARICNRAQNAKVLQKGIRYIEYADNEQIVTHRPSTSLIYYHHILPL